MTLLDLMPKDKVKIQEDTQVDAPISLSKHFDTITSEDDRLLKKTCSMISVDNVLKIHKQLIDKYGGSYGVRDKSLLESALQRPFATYNKLDLYPTAIEKATALLESIVSNHPFVDGNKRTDYFLFRVFLLEHNLDIRLNQEEKYEFVIAIASGKLKGDSLNLFVKGKIK